jgi:hypothetical protein
VNTANYTTANTARCRLEGRALHRACSHRSIEVPYLRLAHTAIPISIDPAMYHTMRLPQLVALASTEFNVRLRVKEILILTIERLY